ncbi:MAG: recombinase family protein [Deltaproteobacteria bacterium]|nr:recombinase family protein [Deltaproteobacteria bacterium]
MKRNGSGGAPRAEQATVRCAIYTRKSTDEGLDQSFNTLDAQREAAEAFIQSQRAEGWEILPDRYDDGGFSGATLERPALKRLLGDIKVGKVGSVVVYKVDRLTRSLLDFARIVEIFDNHHVGFISVSQQFNTATSMGRLMLHTLLSFAQFEREMIAERTRDKMSAARRKGKWVGGMPVLGYDVASEGGRLIVNEAEAARVREIFETYLREQSLAATAADLHARGWTLKSWTTKEGRHRAGRPFNKSTLFALLSNVIYLGQVNYKGTLYPGEHPAIVDPEVWRKVHEVLRHNGRTGGSGVRNKHGALLKGLLRCTPCEAPMVHSYTVRGRKRYRYYVCGRAQKEGWASCPSKSVPAAEVERFVVDRIRALGQDEGLLEETLRQARIQGASEVRAIEAEQEALRTELKGRNAEIQRSLQGDNGASVDPDRLASLEGQVRIVEEKLAEARERLEAECGQMVDERDLTAALSLFDPVWDALFPREQARIMRLLLEGVGYDGGEGMLALTFRPAGITALGREGSAGGQEVAR